MVLLLERQVTGRSGAERTYRGNSFQDNWAEAVGGRFTPGYSGLSCPTTRGEPIGQRCDWLPVQELEYPQQHGTRCPAEIQNIR